VESTIDMPKQDKLKLVSFRLPENAWRDVKAKAAIDGVTVTEVAARIFSRWVDGKIKL